MNPVLHAVQQALAQDRFFRRTSPFHTVRAREFTAIFGLTEIKVVAETGSVFQFAGFPYEKLVEICAMIWVYQYHKMIAINQSLGVCTVAVLACWQTPFAQEAH